ncbi:hypothetical protein LTR62_004918 [Meristemomyces frigidus]|uniref:FAD-binding FR-type domain-containing protein n=1 Tax=Meristemomyces frigidus TaxID=1508187 RepID=A0AAN7TQ62_9PEZI|nr:hypothetical protein LTR62_004918 [Meristemomyces frigidus]
MAPRYALPSALPQPSSGGVGDFGEILNSTAQASPYTHGLNGVTQANDYLLVNILIFILAGLLVATLGYRWLQMGHAHIRHLLTMGSRREEDQRFWMYNQTRIWPWLKTNVLYAPLWKTQHNKEIQLSKAVSIGTLPTRFHTALLLVYVALNAAWCLTLDWGRTNEYSVVAQLRGRSGSLAVFNFIPTIVFAMRNSPLIWMTGVSYDTYNLLHRWCARILTVEVIIHTICWAVNTRASGGERQVWISLATSRSYSWGMVGTCMLATIIILASSPIRHAFYETFLVLHQLLVGLALAGTYCHLHFANLPQLPYVQLAIAIWGAERVWRLARVAYHNISPQHGITSIKVEALPSEACRVTFELSRPWHWKPGCHVYAYLPTYALWSGHPFSIAWAESRPRAEPLIIEMSKMASTHSSIRDKDDTNVSVSTRRSRLTSQMNSVAPTTNTIAMHIHKQQGTNITLQRDSAVTKISLIMRARSGMTRKLYNAANATPTKTLTTWGAIEGPYGGHDPLTSYGTVVLFAGGVGITHCIGYIQHLLLHHAAGTSSTQKILLVWSVPNTESLEWVRVWMDSILALPNRKEVLKMQIFVTKPRHRTEVVSNTGSVQMFPGRCNPVTIMATQMEERIGAVGVMVCGPGAFADSVRSAVRGVVEAGVVDFVEEGFTY